MKCQAILLLIQIAKTMNKVFVTGVGIISAIGNNLHENRNQLQKGEGGIRKAVYLDSIYAKDHLFGEVSLASNLLQKNLNLKKEGLTRTDLLAFTAFNEAVHHAKLSSKEISSDKTAFISASTMGGMCLAEDLYNHGNLSSNKLEYINSYSTNTHALKIAQEYNLTGIVSTINTACSSSANAIILGSRLIKSGKVKRAIVGGTDSLGKFSINGFQSLRILSKSSCQPFDENRSGLTLGEGAAYLILESEDSVGIKKKYAEILGHGNSNDMFHSTSLSENGEGVMHCMNIALRNASINPKQIDYINTHGTATYNNDITELTGINNIFGYFPPFNSTKSYTGHTLAAAGAMEAIYSILSILNQELYSSLNFSIPIKKFNVPPIINHIQNIAINNVLSNSFGFGGNCSSIIIGKA